MASLCYTSAVFRLGKFHRHIRDQGKVFNMAVE